MPGPRTAHRRLRTAALLTTAAATAAALTVGVTWPASADPLPAPYSGTAHGDLVFLPLDVLGGDTAVVP
ncbi:hypothetical protein, partial [Nocardioides pelophilus]|uniref:hypothetical protein n=1 Tax=Nocardioides pelophilus TaxID=2172019 RepID=UPI001C80696A